MTEAASTGAAGLAQNVATAFLYRSIEPLDPVRHGDLAISPDVNFDFARRTHIVPLTAVEFVPAARHYPILFNDDEALSPVALVGVEARRNLFIETDGHWAEGCYMPAFVRRYPFALLRAGEGAKSELQLCVDRDAPMLAPGEGAPLFAEGRASPLLAKVMRFNISYAREMARTRAFTEACRAQDLLVPRAVDFAAGEGRSLKIRGFRVIDDDRLRNLPDAVVIDWWRKGYLPLALAHLGSLGNFGRLFHRASRRLPE